MVANNYRTPGFDSVTDFFSICDNIRDLYKENLTLN